jgi:hypothetical protein
MLLEAKVDGYSQIAFDMVRIQKISIKKNKEKLKVINEFFFGFLPFVLAYFVFE